MSDEDDHFDLPLKEPSEKKEEKTEMTEKTDELAEKKEEKPDQKKEKSEKIEKSHTNSEEKAPLNRSRKEKTQNSAAATEFLALQQIQAAAISEQAKSIAQISTKDFNAEMTSMDEKHRLQLA